MPTLLTNPEFRFYAICACILTLNMQILASMTAAKRNKVKQYVNPEDKAVNFEGASQIEAAEHPEVARVLRAHRNSLENNPLFYGIGLLAVLAGAAPMGIKIAMGTFTGARVLHSIIYLNAAQPWRTISFAIGALSLVALMVMILMAVFAAG